MKETYLVVVNRPKEISIREMEDYLREAIETWGEQQGGSFIRPGHNSDAMVRRATDGRIGALPVLCPVCDGDGFVTLSPGPSDTHFETCPVCGGALRVTVARALETVRRIGQDTIIEAIERKT